MKPLSQQSIRSLRLEEALAAEATTKRNLLPDEPGWDRLVSDSATIASFCANLLAAGYKPSEQVEVAARKTGHGVRPVPYWSYLDRTIYRALTTAVLRRAPSLDRSPEAYLEFVVAPVKYARDLQLEEAGMKRSLFFFLRSRIKYVVKSDITSFYQFVDHGILSQELLFLGADHNLVEALSQLLFEVQGRAFGLPQLFDASDELSEVYIDRVERDLIRKGVDIWRFNDDFRVACRDYPEALSSIEELDRAARRSGLVVNDSKTVSIRFDNYLFETLNKERSDVDETISVDEVELVVGDYTDEFLEEDADAALKVLASAQERGPSTLDFTEDQDDHLINLRNVRADDIRLLRRALNGLVKAVDPRGVPEVVRLAIYIPSLTPGLMRYLMAVAEADKTSVSDVIGQLVANVSKNAWQQIWLVDTIRQLKMLEEDESGSSSVVEWVTNLRLSTRSSALRASTTRAMAAASLIDLPELLADAADAPEALLSTYAAGAIEAFEAYPEADRSRGEKLLQAFAGSSVIHRSLLGSGL